jgi:hypothetical protein
MANMNSTPKVVVTYRKRKGGKVYLEVFENMRVDDIINQRKVKPPIPHQYEIVDIGVGAKFIKEYKEKYKL